MRKTELRELEDQLYRQGLAGFRRIQERHPTDNFYCFAFFTSGEFGYVSITASTYEGLDKVAEEYKKNPRYAAMTLEELRIYLKWSPCDSPLHSANENYLDALDPFMERVVDEFDQVGELDDAQRFYDDLLLNADEEFHEVLTDFASVVNEEVEEQSEYEGDFRSFDEVVSAVKACFENALKRMDAEGVFGRGEARKKVVVNLLMGDQSNEARIEFAERVNPPESVIMLKRDLSARTRKI